MRPPTTRKLPTVTAALCALVVVLGATPAQAVSVDGIDTSHYQHSPTLAWNQVKSDGIAFAFLKATEGSSFKDPYFASDLAETRAAGIYRGAYHFARPSTGSAAKQARFFASVIGPQTGRGTLPPVLDLEATGGMSSTQLIAWTKEFLSTLEGLTGRTPIIYASPAFWEYRLGNTTAFARYPLWIAHYGATSPRVPGGWPRWTFWQTSSSGRVKGISGRVDTDLFNGSLTDLRKLALDNVPQPVSLNLTASNAAPTTGQPVTFSGRLTDNTGAAVASRTVTLSSLTPGSTTWTSLGTAQTSATGSFSLSKPVMAAAGYRATFAGDSDFKPISSSTLSVTLTPLPTRVTMRTSGTSAIAGQQVTFSGRLRPVAALTGRTLLIKVQPTGSTAWLQLGTTTTDATGRYSATFPVLDTGTYAASFIGEPAYAATSALTNVTVTRSASSVSLTARNLAPYRNRGVTLRGQLLSGTTPIAGHSVVVSRLLSGETTWRPVATATTDGSGRFSVRARVDQAAAYRAAFAEDKLFFAATSALQTLTITPAATSHVDLRAGRTHVRTGRAVVLRGRLTDEAGNAVGSRSVQLWRKGVGADRWFKVGRTVTTATGAWRIENLPIRDCVYQARYVGSPRFTASHSQRVRVTLD